MPLWFGIVIAIVSISGGIMCLGIKRLKNTGRGMLLFGSIMALYSVLTAIIMYRG